MFIVMNTYILLRGVTDTLDRTKTLVNMVPNQHNMTIVFVVADLSIYFTGHSEHYFFFLEGIYYSQHQSIPRIGYLEHKLEAKLRQ